MNLSDLADFLIIIGVVGVAWAALVAALELAVNRKVNGPVRTGRPITGSESDLLGDDYRAHVTDYFDRRYRRLEIIREVSQRDSDAA